MFVPTKLQNHTLVEPDTKIKRESLTFCLLPPSCVSKDLLRRFAANASLVVNQLMTTAADEGEDDDSEEEARGGKITYARAADADASVRNDREGWVTEVFLR